MPSSTSITEEICKDHKALAQDYNKILESTNIDTATRWQNQFIWALVRHLVAKEQVVFPAFAKHLGERGMFIIDKNRCQYQSIKTKLQVFQDVNAEETEEFFLALEELMTSLSDHFNEEELADLPALEAVLSSEKSAGLAESFNRRKMFAPSRCHALAPDNAPLETIVGFVAAPMDFFGDLLRKFPAESGDGRRGSGSKLK